MLRSLLLQTPCRRQLLTWVQLRVSSQPQLLALLLLLQRLQKLQQLGV
jgi:hypothetical protein